MNKFLDLSQIIITIQVHGYPAHSALLPEVTPLLKLENQLNVSVLLTISPPKAFFNIF
jgi:hypothetical protein